MRRATAAWVFLCVGTGAIALHFVLTADVHVYDAIALASAGAIFAGVAVHRPAIWRAWVLLGLSQLLMACGDLVYDNITARYPGPADVFYLSGVVVLAVAFVLLAHASPRGAVSANLDAALVTVALGIVVWALGATEDSTGTRLGWLVSAAYPIADVIVIGLGVRMLLAGGRRSMSFWLLLAGILPLFVADLGVRRPLARRARTATARPGSTPAGSRRTSCSARQPCTPRWRARSRAPCRPVAVSMSRVLVIGVAITCAPLAVVVAGLLGRSSTSTTSPAPRRCSSRSSSLRVRADRARARARDPRGLTPSAGSGWSSSAPRSGSRSDATGSCARRTPRSSGCSATRGAELARMHYTEVTDPDDSGPRSEQPSSTRRAATASRSTSATSGRTAPSSTRMSTSPSTSRTDSGSASIEDVTERRELEDQLRQAQKMEAVGKLAGGIAHDFNNLMTAVIGYSDLLLAELDDGDARRRRSTRFATPRCAPSDLTRQLLAFGRRQVLQADEVDLRDVVERMDSLLRRLIGEDIVLETIFGADEIIVRADPTQLEQVVMNLAVNARDAMPDGRHPRRSPCIARRRRAPS